MNRWGCSHWNYGKKFGPHKTRVMGLPGSLMTGWAVSKQYQRVTDRQMDRRTLKTATDQWPFVIKIHKNKFPLMYICFQNNSLLWSIRYDKDFKTGCDNNIWMLLEILFSFRWWNFFENQLRFDDVTTMNLVAPIFWVNGACVVYEALLALTLTITNPKP